MNKKITILYVLSVLLACSFASCSSDEVFEDLESQHTSEHPKTCKLVLNVSKTSYDDEPNTRSATRSVSEWEDGDKIYLTFSTDYGNTYGDAIYKDGEWAVNYYGNLAEGIATKCMAVYFDNPINAGSTVVQLDQHTGIYEDTDGIYVYKDGILSVTAQLIPKTGRIRFAGNNKDSITVYGITHYTSYDASTCKFSTIDVAIREGVSTDYTQYVYGFFTDSIHPRLNIITATSGYNRQLPTNIYRQGESGYLTIPSDYSSIGWQNTLNLKVNDVEFTMIPVSGYAGGFFLLAETETTEQLYNAITGKTPTDSQLPQNLSYSDCEELVLRTKDITNLNFCMPSKDEWQFACKGGSKSLGYTFSGSNIVSDVAWHSGNSGGKAHEVKQLKPNELGFYDMSGNVYEFVFRHGQYYHFYGGSYNDVASHCAANYYSYFSGSGNTISGVGFRIALKP